MLLVLGCALSTACSLYQVDESTPDTDQESIPPQPTKESSPCLISYYEDDVLQHETRRRYDAEGRTIDETFDLINSEFGRYSYVHYLVYRRKWRCAPNAEEAAVEAYEDASGRTDTVRGFYDGRKIWEQVTKTDASGDPATTTSHWSYDASGRQTLYSLFDSQRLRVSRTRRNG